MLDNLKLHSKTIGMKQTMKAVEANQVQAVYIARDADERVVAKLLDACRERGIQVNRAETMKALGKACGIDVGTAVAALLSE